MRLIRFRPGRLWLLSWLVLSPTTLVFSDERPSYFRSRGGVTEGGRRLPDDFGEGARRLWRVALAPGNSTPCVRGDAVYLTTYDESQERLNLLAVDRGGGKVLWSRVIPAETIEPYHPVGSPAATTPACNGRQLFVFFGSHGLLSYDLDGNLLWEKRLGPFQDEFGAASSPVLVDNLVVLNEDHDLESFLIAVDQETGETVWQTPREGFTRSYSTPVILDAGDEKQIVVAGSLQLAGYSAATGEKRWWINGLSRIVDTTPVVVGDSICVATWTPGGDETDRIAMEAFPDALKIYDENRDGRIAKSELPGDSPVVPRFFRIDLDQDQQLNETEWRKHARVFARARNAALRVRPRGTGDLTASGIEWKFDRGLPVVPSPVVFEGVLYMVKDGGILTGLDVETGKLLKQGRSEGRGNYYASLVAGDGKLFACSERGVVTVFNTGRKWEVHSWHDFGERIMATPVIDDGQFFLRTDQALYCFVSARP